ncbi:MAG: hypothetical protein BMS9Abin29_1387 [Gemmatimonadota bacterium]|nr:MAG: hypothetical protein BMS9Abin29_1387 [Gemmatimonadota bacterium]
MELSGESVTRDRWEENGFWSDSRIGSVLREAECELADRHRPGSSFPVRITRYGLLAKKSAMSRAISLAISSKRSEDPLKALPPVSAVKAPIA